MPNFLIGLANVLMVLTSIFLICLVLIQRGKGGGLAGAFGGVGGSSAFGTKAGDVFTRVTIYTALLWFFLALALVWSSNTSDQASRGGAFAGEDDVVDAPLTPGGSGTDAAPSGSSPVPPPPVVPKATDAAVPPVTTPLNPADAALKPTGTLPPALPADAPPSGTP